MRIPDTRSTALETKFYLIQTQNSLLFVKVNTFVEAERVEMVRNPRSKSLSHQNPTYRMPFESLKSCGLSFTFIKSTDFGPLCRTDNVFFRPHDR